MAKLPAPQHLPRVIDQIATRAPEEQAADSIGEAAVSDAQPLLLQKQRPAPIRGEKAIERGPVADLRMVAAAGAKKQRHPMTTHRLEIAGYLSGRIGEVTGNGHANLCGIRAGRCRQLHEQQQEHCHQYSGSALPALCTPPPTRRQPDTLEVASQRASCVSSRPRVLFLAHYNARRAELADRNAVNSP
jgi:hypothetical protein